ncbi:MAG: SDR family NAD(P)-dependent oxidoreductase [Atribacterota bacterium]
MSEMDLRGKTIIITGASRGMGKAISIAIARAGAKVILVARNQEKLQKVKEEINQFNGKSEIITADFSKEDDVNNLFNEVEDNYGCLDVLINNAAVASKGSIEDVSMEEFDYMMNVNLRSVFLACKRAVKLMKKHNNGYIINIASVSGIKAYEKQGAYGISKHGVMGLTKSFAIDLQSKNIRVSAIMPGSVDTDMMRNSGRTDIDFSKVMTPDDIARTVLYLLSLWDTNAAVDEIYIRRKAKKPF